MTSFISALSFLLVVLVGSCFTLPVDQLLSNSSFNHDSTTDHSLHLGFVSDDKTSTLPNLDIQSTSVETSTSNLANEKIARALRIFDELLASTTPESVLNNNDNNSSTTVESTTQDAHLELRGIVAEFENKTEPKISKDGMKVESTTSYLSSSSPSSWSSSWSSSSSPSSWLSSWSSSSSPSSWPSSSSSSSSTTGSSTVVPEFTTLGTSTKKYTGFLKDAEETEEPKKFINPPRKSSLTSKVPLKTEFDDKTEEHLKNSTIPTAVFEQSGLPQASNVPSDVLVLDESDDLVVTSELPTKYSTTTKANKEKPTLLNQGEKPSHTEEEKSNN